MKSAMRGFGGAPGQKCYQCGQFGVSRPLHLSLRLPKLTNIKVTLLDPAQELLVGSEVVSLVDLEVVDSK